MTTTGAPQAEQRAEIPQDALQALIDRITAEVKAQEARDAAARAAGRVEPTKKKEEMGKDELTAQLVKEAVLTVVAAKEVAAKESPLVSNALKDERIKVQIGKLKVAKEHLKGREGGKNKDVAVAIRLIDVTMQELDRSVGGRAMDNPRTPIDQLAIMITGKSFGELKKTGVDLAVARKLLFVSQYAADKGGLTSEELKNVNLLRSSAMAVLDGSEEGRKVLAQFNKGSYKNKTGGWLASYESEALLFLGDPDGNDTDQLKRTDFIKTVKSNPIALVEALHNFAKNLGEGKVTSIFNNEITKIANLSELKFLQKMQSEELKANLGINKAQRQEMRDFISGTFENAEDPVLFMDLVLEKISTMPAGTAFEDKLKEATRLVSQYNVPGLDGKPIYELGALLSNAEAEILCTVRERILSQTIRELIAGDLITSSEFVVLGAQKNTEFGPDDSLTDSQKAHIRLLVLTKDGRFIFLDPSEQGEKSFQVVDVEKEFSDKTQKEALKLYDKYKTNPNAEDSELIWANGKIEVVRSEAALVTLVDEADILNTAALNGDIGLAKYVLEKLNKDNVQAHLLVASLTKDETEKKLHLNLARTAKKGVNEWLRNATDEALESVLKDSTKLTTEITHADAQNIIEDLRRRRASVEDWDKELFDPTIATIAAEGEQGRFSNDFDRGLGLLQAAVTDAASNLNLWASDITESQASEKVIYLETQFRLADVDTAISLGKYERAIEVGEKFKWSQQYGVYDESSPNKILGLDIARNAVDNSEIMAIARDRGLYTYHYRQLEVIARKALEDKNRFLVNPLTDNQIKMASTLAPKLSYTDFTYSRRMPDGEMLGGRQGFTTHKGHNLAKLFDMLFGEENFLNPTEKIMVEAAGDANIRGRTRGFNDGPGMLTHRGLLLRQIDNVYLKDEGLGRRLRDGLSQDEYQGLLADLNAAALDIERVKRLSPIQRASVEPNFFTTGIVASVRETLIRNGYDDAALQNTAGLEAAIAKESVDLNSRIRSYDTYYNGGQERSVWKQETLGRILLFGNASHLVDVYFSNSTRQYDIFQRTGANAGTTGARDAQVARGKEINSEYYGMEHIIRGRNVDFEVASGKIGRMATNASDFLNNNPGSLASVKANILAARAVTAAAKTAYDNAAGNPPLDPAILPLWTTLGAEETALNAAKAMLDRDVPANHAVNETAYRAAMAAYRTAELAYNTAIKPLEDALKNAKNAEATAGKGPAGKAYLNLENAQKAATDHRNSIQEYIDNFCAGGLNNGLRDHYLRQLAKAEAARVALNAAFAAPDNINLLNNAALAARNSVVDRLNWNQILTAENWLDFQGIGVDDAFTGVDPITGKQIPRTSAQRQANRAANLAARAARMAEAQTAVNNLRFLYEQKAVLVGGQNNWNRINNLVNSANPLQGAAGLRDFTFRNQGDNIWEQILDPNSVIEGRINKGHGGKAYIAFYGDDVLRVADYNKEISQEAANKPLKSRFGDAGGAQKDVEAVKGVLNNPISDEAWGKIPGNNKVYNEIGTELDANAVLLDAAAKVRAQALLVRVILPDPISRMAELLFPGLRSMLGRVSPDFFESDHNEFLRRWVDSMVTKNVTSSFWATNIKRKRRFGVGISSISYITSFLQWIILYFLTNPDQVTGLELKL